MKSIRLIWMAALSALILAGCATSSKINSIGLGMTKDEVIQRMGPPDSISAINGTEYMNYALFETTQDARWGRSTPYFVRIIDGHVNAYGRQGDFDSTKTPTQVIQIQKQSDEQITVRGDRG